MDKKTATPNLPTFINIPLFIYQDKNLEWAEKFLFANLWSHHQAGNSIFMTNSYLAVMLNVSDRYVRELLESLERKGYIKRTLTPGKLRTISVIKSANGIITMPDTPEPEFPPPRNCSSPHPGTVVPPYNKIDNKKDNNGQQPPIVDNFSKDEAQISEPTKITYSEKEPFAFTAHNLDVEKSLNVKNNEDEKAQAKREAIESPKNIEAFNGKFHDRKLTISELYDIAQEKIGSEYRPVRVHGFYKYILQERPTNWPTKLEPTKAKQIYPKTSLTPDENKLIQDYCSQLRANRKPQAELTAELNNIKKRLKATFAPWAREVLSAIEKAEEIGDSGMYKTVMEQAISKIKSEEGVKALKAMKDLLR